MSEIEPGENPETDARGGSEAERLVALRVRLGLTQRELASELGVAHGALAQWETGKHVPPGPVRRLLELYEQELTGDPGAGQRQGPAEPKRAMSAGVSAMWYVLRTLYEQREPSALARRIRRAAQSQYLDALGRLRAMPMKIAQMVGFLDLAVAAPDRRVLDALRVRPPAMAPRILERIVEEELGREPRRLFASWSSSPLVGSIGQVHRAALADGRQLAVKVQHPKVAEALRRDLAYVALLDHVASILMRGQERGVLHEEVSSRILEECDFRLEAERQREARRLFAGDRRMVIPDVVEELSGRRVLTSEWIDGDTLETFASHATQRERDAAGDVIVEFFTQGPFAHGFFHADPNPDNFRFKDGKVAFLDFGRVKRLSPEFLRHWAALERAVLERDRVAVQRALVEMRHVGIVRHFDFDFAQRMMTMLTEPALGDGAYVFKAEYVQRLWRLLLANPNKSRVNYPSDHVFLHQLLFGVVALLVRLGARVECRKKLLRLVYEAGSPVPPPFSDGELRLLGIPVGRWSRGPLAT